MALQYGVLRGRPDRWVREDGDASPHLQIRLLDDTGQPWRIAVNVQSNTGSEVVFWLVDPLHDHPLLTGLATVPTGFSIASHHPDHALDYVRAPLFDWRDGRALPPSGSASADDLQDFLILHLDRCRAAGGEVFAFGDKFSSNLHKPIDIEFGNTDGLHGIHDIHLNQGNRGAHARDNGLFQDGGLVLAYGGRFAGLLLGFQTQAVPTDATGAPTADARTLAELIGSQPGPGPGPGPTPPPVPTGASTIYIERALLNPVGDDAGREAVVLGNLSTAALALDGWRLVDKNGRVTPLDGRSIDGGASLVVALDGKGVQLGNKGGTLALVDGAGGQRDAAVFTAADAGPEDRYVRLHP